MREPSITAVALRAALRAEGVLNDDLEVSVLGADRHDPSLTRLESAVIRAGLISEGRLALLKGTVAGLPALADEAKVVISDALDAKIAQQHGILLVAGAPTTVLMVQDTELNMDAVARTVGPTFQVTLMTAGQFVELWGATYREKVASRRQRSFSTIYGILDEAVASGASDIHLKVGQPPWMRVDGEMRAQTSAPLTAEWLTSEMAKIVGEDLVKEALGPPFRVDTAYPHGNDRFRISLGSDRTGLFVVARLLPSSAMSADQLGLPPAIRQFVELDRGLVLITGPTGSGKTTTLAALVAESLKKQKSIITLEDPIEFEFESRPGRGGLIYQRQLGLHFSSFADALKGAMRQDPDVILVGEMRDLETMRTAITAAETGHLVFGTLHTASAEATVGRLIGQFPEGEQNQVRMQLNSNLKGVVSQSLVRKRSGRGRVGAFEIMVSTPATRSNLRTVEGVRNLKNTLATGMADGMQTMEMALVALVMSGAVDQEEALKYARDISDFNRRLLDARGGGGYVA